MKRVLFIIVMITMLVSTHAMANGSETHGGEIVDVDGRPSLRDLVDKAVCVGGWVGPDEYVRKHAVHFEKLMSLIKPVHTELAYEIRAELNKVSFCLTRARLVRVNTKDKYGVLIYYHKAKQLAVRINNKIYINENYLEKLSPEMKTMVLVHELAHGLVPYDTKRRNFKVKTFTNTLYSVLKSEKPVSPRKLAYLILNTLGKSVIDLFGKKLTCGNGNTIQERLQDCHSKFGSLSVKYPDYKKGSIRLLFRNSKGIEIWINNKLMVFNCDLNDPENNKCKQPEHPENELTGINSRLFGFNNMNPVVFYEWKNISLSIYQILYYDNSLSKRFKAYVRANPVKYFIYAYAMLRKAHLKNKSCRPSTANSSDCEIFKKYTTMGTNILKILKKNTKAISKIMNQKFVLYNFKVYASSLNFMLKGVAGKSVLDSNYYCKVLKGYQYINYYDLDKDMINLLHKIGTLGADITEKCRLYHKEAYTTHEYNGAFLHFIKFSQYKKAEDFVKLFELSKKNLNSEISTRNRNGSKSLTLLEQALFDYKYNLERNGFLSDVTLKIAKYLVDRSSKIKFNMMFSKDAYGFNEARGIAFSKKEKDSQYESYYQDYYKLRKYALGKLKIASLYKVKGEILVRIYELLKRSHEQDNYSLISAIVKVNTQGSNYEKIRTIKKKSELLNSTFLKALYLSVRLKDMNELVQLLEDSIRFEKKSEKGELLAKLINGFIYHYGLGNDEYSRILPLIHLGSKYIKGAVNTVVLNTELAKNDFIRDMVMGEVHAYGCFNGNLDLWKSFLAKNGNGFVTTKDELKAIRSERVRKEYANSGKNGKKMYRILKKFVEKHYKGK